MARGKPLIIDLPFTYRMRGVLPRCRKEEEIVVSETLPVMIDRLDGDQVPIGLEIKNLETGAVGGYRVMEGRPFVPLQPPTVDNKQLDGPLDAAGLKAVLSTIRKRPGSVFWLDYPLPVEDDLVRYYSPRPFDVPARAETEMRTVSHDGRSEARGRAAAAAAGLKLVDGVVYRAAAEPVWVIKFWKADGRMLVKIAFEHEAPSHRALVFRGDKFADAVAMAGLIARDHGHVPVEIENEIAGGIDWRFDAAAHCVEAARAAVETALNERGLRSFSSMPDDFFDAWKAYRTADRKRMFGLEERRTLVSAMRAIWDTLEQGEPASRDLRKGLEIALGRPLQRLDLFEPEYRATLEHRDELDLAAAF